MQQSKRIVNFAITNDPTTGRNTLQVLLDDGSADEIVFDPGNALELHAINKIVRSGEWPISSAP